MLQVQDEKFLNELCDKYGSDKGSLLDSSPYYPWPPHNYTKVYASLFANIKNDSLIVFECGLGTNNPNIKSSMNVNGKPGASLRVWRDFFPNATIYGADIDRDILFSEDRIITGYMDQTNFASVAKFWEVHDVSPDIVIDDGLHEFHAGISLFENSFDRLTKDGIYIIEDMVPEDIEKYKNYFNRTSFNTFFISLGRSSMDWNDNNLLIIFK